MILKLLRTFRRAANELPSLSQSRACPGGSIISETCASCNALFDEYERTEQLADDAFRELRTRNATVALDEYSTLRIALGEAKLDTDLARLQFQEHLDTHGKAG